MSTHDPPDRSADDPEGRLVAVMAGVGVPEAYIARVLGVDLTTLWAHHRRDLATGQVIANARVAESLFRKAIGDSPQAMTAAIFWLKARAGGARSPSSLAIGSTPGSRR